MEPQAVESNTLWHLWRKQAGEMHQQVLAGRLVRHNDQLRSLDVVERRALWNHKSVVEGLYDAPLGKPLYIREIHHHTILGIAGIVDGFTLDGDKQPVVVAVYVAALSVVGRQGVGHLEVEFFCKRPFCG